MLLVGVFLLIIVHSSVDHSAKRDRIRRSWANATELSRRTAWRHNRRGVTPRPRPPRHDPDAAPLNAATTKTVFFVGRPPDGVVDTAAGSRRTAAVLQRDLEKEAEKYGDIVQADFVDSYRSGVFIYCF